MKRAIASTSAGGKNKKSKRYINFLSSDEDEEDVPAIEELAESLPLIANEDIEEQNPQIETASAQTAGNQERTKMTGDTTKYNTFFKIFCVDGQRQGECLLCQKRGIERFIKMKDSNTSGLKRHLAKQHHDDPAVQDEINSKQHFADNDTRTFDQRVVEWLAVKYLPFSFFDDDATQEFFSFLNKKEVYPKRTSMREKVLQHFTAMRAAVFRMLKQVSSKFSLTIDGWTSIANRSYYGITMHYIDPDWKLQSLPLDFIPSNGRHTGKDIASLVLDVLEEFEIKSKIQGITLDNAAANTSFMAELSDLLSHEGIEFDSNNSHFRCFAHILNLGVQDTLSALNVAPPANSDSSGDIDSFGEESEPLRRERVADDDVICKIRRLFAKLRRSEQWTNKLNNCCEAVNTKKITITMDVCTRWNSCYRMLQTALKLKTPLNALVHSYEELQGMKITPEEWSVVETVCSYLKPFEYLSTVLGGQTYVTLPLVIVGFNMLLDSIEATTHQLDSKPHRTIVDEQLILAFQAGRDKMLRHYQKTNWMYGVVLILDPRHKIETFSLTSWGREIEKESVATFENIFREQYCASFTVESTSQPKSVSQESDDGSFDLYALYESTSQISQETNRREWRLEVERYCRLKRASGKEDILQWWRNNATSFPNLARMARDFLSISATSVPAERLFSSAGLVIRKHRNRLTNQSARSLLCINGWMTCSLKSDIQKNLRDIPQE